MKKLALARYHLFEFRDNHYALDIESSAVVPLDPPAYEALALRLTDASPEAISSRLEATYGNDTSQTVLRELRWLEKKGSSSVPFAPTTTPKTKPTSSA